MNKCKKCSYFRILHGKPYCEDIDAYIDPSEPECEQ